MKMLRLVALVFTIAVACAAPSFQPALDKHWEDFMMTFNRSYNCQEKIFRRALWEENLAKIIIHNIEADLGKHSYKMGINHLTDMSTEEVNKMLNGFQMRRGPSKSITTFVPPFNSVVPEEVDWRKEGLVTPVKNQGNCGSCWAFSTTGSLESQHKKKTGTLVSLSEQNLVDCSFDEGDMGCSGGMTDYAFEYIKENGGIDTEDCYPYEAQNDRCRYNAKCTGATVVGYVDITAGDEGALRTATATVGPISVAIDASHRSFHYYSGGIYNEPECSSLKLDHAVLIVGYGAENGQDYWLVKNSWGPQWGENGYIKMRRNYNNLCGIASQASYPLV